MTPYYILVALPFLMSVVQFESQAREMVQKKKNYPILIFFGIYFLLLALRHVSIGADTLAYETVFSNISNTAWKDLLNYKSSEIGYTLLNKLVSSLGGDYQVFLMVASAFIAFPLAKLYYDFSENSMVSIALFLVLPVFIMNFSGLRQALAVSMGVLAFYATKNRRLIGFLLCVFVAFSFHQSGIVLLLLYPLYRIRLRFVHMLALLPGYVFAFFFRERIFLNLLPIMGEKYAERYSEVTDTGATTMLILFSIFLIYSFIVPNEENVDEVTNGCRNMLALAVFIQMFSTISVITMRMNYYFLIFLPVLIPRITNRWKSADQFIRNAVNIVMIAFFLLYYFIKAYSVDSMNIYPYIPFWN